MFLRPQHFQSADRYWSELLATALQSDNPYNYGLHRIELSTEALSNFQVQVTRCRARTRDGSLIDVELGQEPDRVDLKPALEDQATVMVYLGCRKLRLGRRNLGERFGETVLPIPDESAGGNEQEIQFREVNWRILLSTDDLEGWETLPIARIKRAGGEAALPVLDDDYFPPSLALDAWAPLGMDLVRPLYDYIGVRIETLSQRAVDRGLTFSSQEPGDLDELLKLIQLNQAYAVLSCLTFAQGVHPLWAYTELCRVVGMLSIFDEKVRRTPEIPPYDHDDLARIFQWVDLRIRELLKETPGPGGVPYEMRYFEGRQLGMCVHIKSEWLHSGWKWYVGVLGRNVSRDECRVLLDEGNLDWKLGSDSKVDRLFQYAIPSVEKREVERPPKVFPTHQGWIYYEVVRDRQNAAWQNVLAEETLALRFAEEYVGNKETLKGQRQLELVKDNKRAILEFALFAVPPAVSK